MRYRFLFVVSFVCAFALSSFAQEPLKTPDLQTIDDGFFDPTRKETKQEEYHFSYDYRLEVGYNQVNQRVMNDTNSLSYLHGARLGVTFDLHLPLHFSVQTGILYSLSYGRYEQHWRSTNPMTVQPEYLKHNILQHNLTIPMRVAYTIPLWKKLNLFFYGGPQLQITLGETDYIKRNLSAEAQAWMQSRNIRTETYDKIWTGEYLPVNIQLGVGGGLEWDRYRLQSGYDFGLNNRVLRPIASGQKLWDWGWYVSFSYKL